MLDKALLLQEFHGLLWNEDEATRTAEQLEHVKTLPVEEKKPSFSFIGQTLNSNEEAWQVLREAMNNPDLLYNIKERASIRWSNGLSDSLFSAVLCNLKPLNEKAERDSNGEIILKPQTDWQEELAKFESNEK